MLDFTNCPECGGTAEIRDRVVLDSTDAPVEHAKIFCVRGHWFFMPVAGLETCDYRGSVDADGPGARDGTIERDALRCGAPGRFYTSSSAVRES